MSSQVTICYYITGHGLGHASRAVQIINSLPKSWTIYVKSNADEKFLKREIRRSNAKIFLESWDSGLCQINNRRIDCEQSLSNAIDSEEEFQRKIPREIEFLQTNNVRLVISDIAPTPLLIAKQADIPSVFIGNFTWIEIFRKLFPANPKADSLINHWLSCYETASISIKLTPCFAMDYLNNSVISPPLGRIGHPIRERLAEYLRVPETTKIVLLYFGNFGATEISIPAIPNTVFLSFIPGNIKATYIDPNKWKFADVLSSCDAVVAKPGYGIISEAALNGIPVLVHPRDEFAEYEILKEFLSKHDKGIVIPDSDFCSGNWLSYLETACSLKKNPLLTDGTKEIVSLINSLI